MTSNTPDLVPANGAPEGSYFVVVTQSVGKGYVSLKNEKLAAPGLMATLKSNGADAKFTLPVFQVMKGSKKWGIREAGTKLGNAFDTLQRKCQMISAGDNRWWFPARFKADFDAGWEELMKLQEELIQELLDSAEEARQIYDGRLQAILTQADAMEDFYKFSLEFPTNDQIRENFKLNLKEGPIRVPSVTDIAKLSPELQFWMGQIRKTMMEDLPKTSAKLSKAIALFFNRLRDFDPAAPDEKSVPHLANSWLGIKGLVELFDEMSGGGQVGDPVRSLADKALEFSPQNPSYPKDKGELQVRLDAIQEDLLNQDWIQEPTAANAELSKWCGVSSLEDRLKDLKQRIDTMAAMEDGEEKDCLLKELRIEARSYSGILKGTASKLLSLVGMDVLEEVPAPTPEAEVEVAEEAEVEEIEEEEEAPAPPVPAPAPEAEVEEDEEIEEELDEGEQDAPVELDDVALAGF